MNLSSGVAALLLASTLFGAACTSCSSTGTQNANSQSNAASSNTGGAATTPPPNNAASPGQLVGSNSNLNAEGPLSKGATTRVYARAITAPCYKNNPSMTQENLDICSKEAVAAGTPIVFLGKDGVVYIPELDPAMTMEYKVFIGEDLLVDGNVHEEAKELSWPGVTVKKMEIIRVRKRSIIGATAVNRNANVAATSNAVPATSKPAAKP
jgi:hypothetical protein